MRVVFLLVALAAGCSAQWVNPLDLGRENPPVPEPLYQDLLKALCPGQSFTEKGEHGCRVCPSGTADAGMKEDSTVRSVAAGHFSSPKQDQVWAVLYGCEPHANSFVDAFLFTRTPKGWGARKIDGPTGTCDKITSPDGREGLLCFAADMFSGVGSGTLSFAYPGGKAQTILTSVIVTSQCMPTSNQPWAADSSIQGLRLDRQPDGRTALTVKAECSRWRKVCRQGNDVAQHPARQFQLEFEFDGTAFRARPDSAAALKAWEACSNFNFQ